LNIYLKIYKNMDNKIIETSASVLTKKTADIDGYIELRQNFIYKVNAICVEGKDYHVIQGKKSLAKGGAEKIASIFTWVAKFEKDTESLEMLGDTKGLVAFKCTLYNQKKVNGAFVGEGRGSAMLSRNNNDANKTLKMAQKSAFIDAVLRASGLSDFFTQDLEDMPREDIETKPAYTNDGNIVETPIHTPASPKQLTLIGMLCKQKGYSKEDILAQGFTKLTGGKGGTASQLIDWLLKAKAKTTNEELPVIQQEPSGDEASYATTDEIANNLPF
jgi:hypothetical protein